MSHQQNWESEFCHSPVFSLYAYDRYPLVEICQKPQKKWYLDLRVFPLIALHSSPTDGRVGPKAEDPFAQTEERGFMGFCVETTSIRI